MNKNDFKLGSRIKTSKVLSKFFSCGHVPKGVEGKIVQLTLNDPIYPIGMEFDDSSHGMHSCDGSGKGGYCRYVHFNDIELVSIRPEMIQPLKDSIAIWEQRSRGEAASDNCPLCRRRSELSFNSINTKATCLKYCPLAQAGHRCNEDNSLWDKWAKHKTRENASKILRVLRSLLPVEKEEVKEKAGFEAHLADTIQHQIADHVAEYHGEKREEPRRRGYGWTYSEDTRFNGGFKRFIDRVADTHKRTPRSVMFRMLKYLKEEGIE